MLRPTLGSDVRDTPSDGKVTGGVSGIADGDTDTRVSPCVAHLLMGLNRVDDYMVTIGVGPDLGRLRRAVGHQGGDEARVPTRQ